MSPPELTKIYPAITTPIVPKTKTRPSRKFLIFKIAAPMPTGSPANPVVDQFTKAKAKVPTIAPTKEYIKIFLAEETFPVSPPELIKIYPAITTPIVAIKTTILTKKLAIFKMALYIGVASVPEAGLIVGAPTGGVPPRIAIAKKGTKKNEKTTNAKSKYFLFI